MNVFESTGPEDTYELGFRIGKEAQAGQVYLLNGNLGAGKTVFAKGFARGLGIADDITSPTFTIVNEYLGRLKLCHFDLYRIEYADELYHTGFEDYLDGSGVLLIEWPEIALHLLPKDAVRISISHENENGEQYRRITIEN